MTCVFSDWYKSVIEKENCVSNLLLYRVIEYKGKLLFCNFFLVKHKEHACSYPFALNTI